MNKQIKSDNFKRLVESITERMVDQTRRMNNALIEDNKIAEDEARTMYRAFDLVLFSINLQSTVVDEKESV